MSNVHTAHVLLIRIIIVIISCRIYAIYIYIYVEPVIMYHIGYLCKCVYWSLRVSNVHTAHVLLMRIIIVIISCCVYAIYTFMLSQ